MLTLTPTDHPAESIMPPIDRGARRHTRALRREYKRGLCRVGGRVGGVEGRDFTKSLHPPRVAICSISPLMPVLFAISHD